MHEDGRSANATFDNEAKNYIDFAGSLATEDQIMDRVLKHRATSSSGAADVGNPDETEEPEVGESSSVSDMDMAFSSWKAAPVPTHAAAAAKRAPAGQEAASGRGCPQGPSKAPNLTLVVSHLLLNSKPAKEESVS